MNIRQIRPEVCVSAKKYANPLGRSANQDLKESPRDHSGCPIPREANIDLFLRTQNHLFISLLEVLSSARCYFISESFRRSAKHQSSWFIATFTKASLATPV
ncbi:hypothetical protein AVEN_102148-1 [Araneus ventricosus]|uniref:Uncharacterized protein n=1 Tax=Araneus ventricosus TaxID=182803 RepID=A0A4Y2LQD0_ARAVE|nr:hypothetical protein AVEN_102148-1 [Araneus ventricosus]